MTPHAESEVLSAYLDGELEHAAAANVETHLGECRECAARLEDLQETVASLRQLERPPLPEAVTRGLRQRLQRERARPRAGEWLGALLPWRSLQPGLAAGVLVFGALLFLVYAGYLQQEREGRRVIFSAEERAAPPAAPATGAGGDAPQPEPEPAEPEALSKLEPPKPPAPSAPPAGRRATPPPAAGVAGGVAAEAPPAVPPSDRDAALADAAEPATPAEPQEPSRREAREATATLRATGEMAGAAAAPPTAAAESEPLRLGPGIEPPVRIPGEQLAFERVAAANWPPLVMLEAVITREGRMENIQIVKPADLDPRLAAELRRTLETWRYRPATRDGEPVAVRMTLTVNIHLH